ncbi:MAG TPA: MBL fold metallo-hydrolase [Acidimicrobiales bacterium]|nr:MBL fold metallo-hydrolase [Acidimicrobiales bacterium]
MRITFLGHAGLFIETSRGTILCDPWFNPAYFGSWFPFPSNEDVDVDAISRPDYLYLSHLHHDHFDPAFLRERVWKQATVLLPDYPLGAMARELTALGFTRFVETRNGEPLSLDGLRIAIPAVISPADGPLGDSGLIVDDGQVRIFDQNDCRPVELDRLQELGPFDAHFIQFSGATWYPFVYQYPPGTMDTLARSKRANGMTRALRYAHEIDARYLFPSAGPPCFLDEQLFDLNDFGDDAANPFPDQRAFLNYLRSHGNDRGRLVMPGSVISLEPGRCHVDHVESPEQEEAFADKRTYLLRYQARQRDKLEAIRASWPRGQVDVVTELREWFEPLLERADIICAGVGGVVALDLGSDGVAIDFNRRRVEPLDGQEWFHYLKVDRSLVEYCITHHLEDWVNELFLSFRFQARRKGPYNEYVYTFFKCLSMERLQYAEGYYAERSSSDQFWEVDGYRIQRRCPHLKADLTKFGRIEGGILTCTLHGWQYELATGRSLTSDDTTLYCRPLVANGQEPDAKQEASRIVHP